MTTINSVYSFTVPQKVKNLKSTFSVSTCLLQWEASEDCYYKVEGCQYASTSSQLWSFFMLSTKKTFFAQDLIPNTRYVFRVIAKNLIGDSETVETSGMTAATGYSEAVETGVTAAAR